MTIKYNGRLEREARMEPPIHIDSTSGWLPSRGGCNLLYPPKFATASWPIVPSTAAELPRCTATESLCTSFLYWLQSSNSRDPPKF